MPNSLAVLAAARLSVDKILELVKSLQSQSNSLAFPSFLFYGHIATPKYGKIYASFLSVVYTSQGWRQK